MKHTRLFLTLIVMSFLTVVCGAPRTENVDNPELTTIPVSTSQIESPTETPTEVQGEPFISAPGIAAIRLLTDMENVGAKPLFLWEAIPDADNYHLIVFDEAGEPYWAWEGRKTQIYMGGTDTQPPDDSSGPSIGLGYTWAVVAYASDGQVLAASEIRSIAP